MRPVAVNSQTLKLVEVLTDRLGPPVVKHWRAGELSPPDVPLGDEFARFYRFPCPVCGGGFGDPLRLYRPLVVAENGEVFCRASSCTFTVGKLAMALDLGEAA